MAFLQYPGLKNRNYSVISFILLFSLFISTEVQSQNKYVSHIISKEKIDQMFANMKANGVNSNTVMLWGYFFTNEKSGPLKIVASELEQKKFKFVEIYQDSGQIYWLHMERQEIHNSESLFELDKDLYAIAEKYKLRSYDGFDVGNVDKTKPIERDDYAVREDFKVIDIVVKDYPMILMGNIAFDNFPHQEEFCYFIKIQCKYKSTNGSLLPDEKAMDAFEIFDSSIQEKLDKRGIKNYYVYRAYYKNMRTCYLVTKDEDAVKKAMTEIKQSENSMPFEFEIVVDKKWSQYRDIREKLGN